MAVTRRPQIIPNAPVSRKAYVAPPPPAPKPLPSPPAILPARPRLRPDNWAIKHYHDFLQQRKNVPFSWGKNDCALFAADGIKAITGIDIAADFRGKYTTQLGALAAIKKITGGSTIADAAAYCASKNSYFVELEHPLMAQRADLVIVTNGDGSPIAGLVHLTGTQVVTVSEHGLFTLPITSVQRAWHYE